MYVLPAAVSSEEASSRSPCEGLLDSSVIKFSLILFLPKDWEADPGLSEMLCLQLISCILRLVSLLVKRWAVAEIVLVDVLLFHLDEYVYKEIVWFW